MYTNILTHKHTKTHTRRQTQTDTNKNTHKTHTDEHTNAYLHTPHFTHEEQRIRRESLAVGCTRFCVRHFPPGASACIT